MIAEIERRMRRSRSGLGGEDFDQFATLDEARKCFDNIEQLYNN